MYKIIALTCFSLLLLGCNQSKGPKIYQVTGAISVDGTPLDGGSVSFEEPSTGNAAGGSIEDGKFALPLPAGNYKVVVEPATVEVPSRDGNSPPSAKELDNVPKVYRSVTTTELEAAVSEGKTHFEFNLKK